MLKSKTKTKTKIPNPEGPTLRPETQNSNPETRIPKPEMRPPKSETFSREDRRSTSRSSHCPRRFNSHLMSQHPALEARLSGNPCLTTLNKPRDSVLRASGRVYAPRYLPAPSHLYPKPSSTSIDLRSPHMYSASIQEGRYKATWKRGFKLPRREASLLQSSRLLSRFGPVGCQ